MLFNIALVLFFVALNGFFVAAEFAIVKVRSSQIEMRIRAGSKLAVLAKSMIHHLDAYLSATQLGITLASLGLGWIGQSVVSEIIIDITKYLGFDLDPVLAHKIALPAAFLTITILHIVFGELAPKSLAIQRPEQMTLALAVPLRLFYILFKPFIWTLNSFANHFIKLLGFEPVSEEQELHSADELRYLITESSKSGILEDSEHKMLENVFELSDTPVKQIMIPRKNVVGVEISMDIDGLIGLIVEEGYSRLPVYEGSLDNILGIIYAKDMISMLSHSDLIIIHDIIRPAFSVNEEEKINVLLKNLQQNKIHLAIVVDEFGGTAGIVTLEDILEEIVGEIQDEYDEEMPIVVDKGNNEFLVNAGSAIDDVNEFLPEPLPDSDDYESVGGLIVNELGRIPYKYEQIELEDYLCTIIQRSKRNIDQIKLLLKEQKKDKDESNNIS